jgi:glycine dehydrogenase subunit 1
MALLGETGLTRIAKLSHWRACQLADRLTAISGVALVTPTFFNEFTLRLPKSAAAVVDALAGLNILGGVPASRLYPQQENFDDLLIVAATETNSEEDIAAFAAALEGVLAC